jgi:putative ABC transport system permease protein
MPIPLSYSYRNLLARRLTSFLTAGGMGLVVFVFAAALMLTEGLRQTLVATGSYDNAVVLRAGSETEVQSALDRTQAAIVASQPEIAMGAQEPLVASEAIILINLPKRGTSRPANVMLRGVQSASFPLRREVKLVEGRWFRPGSNELVAGMQMARRFQGAGLGETLRFAMRTWRIVGVFDAGNTGFSSEIWGDVEQLLQAFRRNAYSSAILRLRDPGPLLISRPAWRATPACPCRCAGRWSFTKPSPSVWRILSGFWGWCSRASSGWARSWGPW